MRQLRGASVCPHCGFDNAAAQNIEVLYHLRRGTMLANRYLVGRVIGEGGFGITYIGMDTTLSKRVAIKEFYPSGAANRTNKESDDVIVTTGREGFFNKGVECFLLEAKSVAKFSEEEGIVDVLDYFQANGTAYIVMEYLDGETLKDRVNRRGCFKLEELVGLMMPVMRSLSVIHAEGIIHRDISPDNLMLTKRGKLKLMDFGSARYYTNEERKMSVILKQGFAPEEQYRQNGKQGPYTDVYALCATMYACITGKVPVSSLDRLGEDTLLPPSQLGAVVLPYQEHALMHGMALLAKNRTPDMGTLIRELTTKTSLDYDRTVAADEAGADKSGAGKGQERQAWRTVPQNQNGAAPEKEQQADKQRVVKQEQKSAAETDKKSKMTLIIAAVAAVVIIGGGIIAGIALFGGSKQPTPAAPQSTALSSQASSSSSAVSSSKAESSKTTSSKASSSKASSSKATSSKTSSDAHKLYSENGTLLLEDDAIDTEDLSAELKLRNYVGDGLHDSVKNSFKTNGYVCGNTYVDELIYQTELSDEEIAEAASYEDSWKNDETLKSARHTMRVSTGIANAQYVYAEYTRDGNLIFAVLINE